MPRKKGVGPFLSPTVYDWICLMFPNPNRGVTYATESMEALFNRTVAHELKGVFSISELSLILDAMNGLYLEPAFAGQHVLLNVEDAIALDGLDKKWKVSKNDLLTKIKSLTIYQAFVIEVWSIGFWDGNNGENYSKANAITEWCKVLLP